MGAGAKHRLVFVDRLLTTLVHLRHATTHDVLACWFGVDRSSITRAIGEAGSPFPGVSSDRPQWEQGSPGDGSPWSD
ncbi:helix-turn-helix domain-containing protein [Streptomyces sviceus]|uniref:helix-turn-helix domain-containing protein n=1 Tax=Streptomyces sviceus TaxID=285530 RepID=UPI0036E2F647